MSDNINNIIESSDILVLAVPSAYIKNALAGVVASSLKNKKILSAIKGIIPDQDILLNEYLLKEFSIPIENYFAVLGPCHAEEVAAEKLSYLTFSGVDVSMTQQIAACFKTEYINTITNHDILGVQYAAVLKNIYALGAGIAHGLEHHHTDPYTLKKDINYAASVYLGDLLVTCYSPYSRNRTFGTMIGKGYTVQSAQLELNMVAEGYNASKCIYNINKKINYDLPIAETVYKILWERLLPAEGFYKIEEIMV
jgi:glycerol-3-phosphate dehydrogenase (NAD(P)+)